MWDIKFNNISGYQGTVISATKYIYSGEFWCFGSSNVDPISGILIHLLWLDAGFTWTATSIHPVVWRKVKI
jgi:hypothetical protein